MPVIEVDYKDLCSLLGREMKMDKLVEKIPMIGADIEGYDRDKISIEMFPNRPDLYSTEGIARALRTFLGIDIGLKKYRLESSDTILMVDKSVKGIREHVVACEVSGVKLNDLLIQELMDLQEDLHWALGRDRRKVAIGVHDSSAIKAPYLYTTVKPEEIKFVPLGMSKEMTPGDILKKHPKGIDYAHILNDFDRHPIIFDSRMQVLSVPPIINGELTKVTKTTTDFFVEMTGTDFRLLNQTLNILSTAFMERGWVVKTVKIRQPGKTYTTPDFSTEDKILNVKYVNDALGLELKPREIALCLQKMGFDTKIGKGGIKVSIPCYRTDILHDIDFVEDVAIGYGYNKLKPAIPDIATIGEERSLEKFCDRARELMIGYGFTEIMTLMLSNLQNRFTRTPTKGSAIEIENPISEEHNTIRTSLFPSLFEVLEINKHREMPQRIFEVGDIIILDKGTETGGKEQRNLCGCVISSKANFTDIKSIVEGLLRDLGVEKWSIKGYRHESFIEGRCGSIAIKNKLVGYLGEFHPETITNFGLEYPVVGFEVDIERIMVAG